MVERHGKIVFRVKRSKRNERDRENYFQLNFIIFFDFLIGDISSCDEDRDFYFVLKGLSRSQLSNVRSNVAKKSVFKVKRSKPNECGKENEFQLIFFRIFDRQYFKL